MDNTLKTMDQNLLHDLISQKFPKLTLGETANEVLRRFVNVDVTTTALSEVLKHNQMYHFGLEFYVQSKLGGRSLEERSHAEEEKPQKAAKKTSGKDVKTASSEEKEATVKHGSLAQSIMMLGILGTRNVVMAMRIMRAFHREWPFIKETVDEKKKFSPDEYINYAQKAQEFCTTYKVPYAESTAFAGGLLFDWVRVLYSDVGTKNAPVAKYLDELWRKSIRAAYLSSRFSQKIRGFAYLKYAFPAALVQNIGKFILCIQTMKPEGGSAWLDFEKSCEKIPEPGQREVRYIKEREAFNITHDEISSMALFYFSILKPVAPAVRYHHSPYYLRHTNKDQFALASCLALASIMAEYGKPAEKTQAPWKNLLECPWFNELGLKDQDFQEITKVASGMGI